MTNEEILNIFFLECEEALGSAETGLIDCREGTANAETVNSIFRAVHSIKGGAGAFGFTALQAFTHKFETVLSFVREGQIPLGDSLNSLMLRAFDILTDHVSAARGEADLPDDGALSAELEDVAAKAELGQPIDGGAAALDDGACAEPDAGGGNDPVLDFDLDDLIGAISDDNGAPPADDGPSGWSVLVRPRAGALANGGDPLLLLREMVALGGRCVKIDVQHVPELALFDAANAYVGFVFELPGNVDEEQIREIFDFVGDDVALELTRVNPAAAFATMMADPPEVLDSTPVAESVIAVSVLDPVSVSTPVPAPADSAPAQAAPVTVPTAASSEQASAIASSAASVAASGGESGRKVQTAGGQTIRVDLAKLDRLIDTVGELVIAQAMMAQRLSDHGLAQIDELGMLDHLTRELQDSAMSIRAQPIGSVFSRVPRIVRELEAETGKRVRLEVSGEHTELDKTVVERLGEPLTHLIRNAIDHGLERAEDRVAVGKSPEGTVRLAAEHRSGKILISISDDGAGINRERVFNKAVEKGLIAADAQLSDEEIDNLIFAPGFSTAQQISNISGRGVGMDVVRQNVKDLGGRITIHSTPGKGSTFTLALPLTLAISDGMIVQVGEQTLVVPLAHVVESLRPTSDQLRSMGNGRQMLDVRGIFLPIISVHSHVSGELGNTRPEDSVLIVVETEDSGSAILQVDSILDQRQFVIKSLETNYRPVPCVAGATILGDGKVALILDVDALVGSSVQVSSGLRLAA